MTTTVAETPAAPLPQPESPLEWLRGWNRFWFQPAEPTIPCMMRILCGILTLYVHLSYSFGLYSWVGPEGWTDRQVVSWLINDVKFFPPQIEWKAPPKPVEGDTGYAAWSVWYHVEDPTWIVILHVVFLLAMLSYTLGFCTRVSGVITWIATLSYINRIPNMVFGMDAMMAIVQFYLLIAPCGAMYSVDAWLAKRRIGWWRDGAVDPNKPPKSVAANLALRLLQVHFCFVYAVSGLSKLQGHTWWSGEAIWGTIANPNFSPMQSDLFLNFLFFLAKHRWLYHLFVSGGVVFTLFLEIGFPALVWNKRTRWLMITGSVLLHTGIGFLMGLGGFSLFMLVFVMAFMPPETVLAFLGQLKAHWQNALGKYAPRLATPKGPEPAAHQQAGELALR
jgi:hypothetical protein